MRRKMTFRSNCVAGVLAAVTVGGTPLLAQDSVQVAQQAELPAAHVVSEGETLWDLAQRYFGDPFLWPEIYRLNTMVVEDPHWIFPGEELQLGPVEVTRVAQGEPERIESPEATPGVAPEPEGEQPIMVEPGAPDMAEPVAGEPEAPPLGTPAPPPPTTEDVPTIFLATRDEGGAGVARFRAAAYRYRPVRAGEFYAAGFLTEGQYLPWAEVEGAVGKPTLARIEATSSSHILGEIEIRPPAGATYAVGDSLLVATLGRELGDWGEIVRPTGIARVTHVGRTRVIAEVVAQFERIADGQVAMPLEPFPDPGFVVPTPVENGMMGTIIDKQRPTPVAGQQHILYLDMGRRDGVTLGDVFEVVRPRSERAPQSGADWEQVAVMQIVHVRERSATGFLTHLNGLGVDAGAPVRLMRKMPM